MLVYRISAEPYSHELSASGAANRWNLRGQPVIYTGCSRALSTLELIVHRSAIVPNIPYKMMVISLNMQEIQLEELDLHQLPAHWRTLAAYNTLQNLGSNWFTKQQSLVLKVPSAVIPQESNYIINTEHPHFQKHVTLLRTEPYFWDNRLL